VRSVRTVLVLALVLGTAGVPTGQAPAAQADCDAACIGQLKAQFGRLRAIRDRHQRGEFTRSLAQNASELDNMGFEQLPSTKAIVDASVEALKGAVDIGARAATVGPRSDSPGDLLDFKKRQDAVAKYSKRAIEITETWYGAAEALGKLQERSKDPTTQAETLDRMISNIENTRALVKAGLTADVSGALETPVSYIDATISMPLALAYVERGRLAGNASEARKFYDLAAKEAGNVIKNGMSGAAPIFEARGVESAGAIGALTVANFEIWSRLVYWAGAHYAANREYGRAEALNNDAIAALTKRMADTGRLIEQADKRMADRKRTPILPVREPGGIKFSGASADLLAARLDVTGMAFDAASGRLVLTGPRSNFAVNGAVFRDVLRLALERHDPFFSLNPVNAKDWDEKSTFVRDRILKRYFRSPEGRVEFAARLQRSGVGVETGGRVCYAATVDDFDRDLQSELDEALDIREERVYSPEWLAFSPVGRILFEADLAIKAVAAGLLETGDTPSRAMADVWSIPGFRPRWLAPPEDVLAGRANFELDASAVVDDAGLLDLSAVKPKLVMVRRKPGTSEDLEPSSQDRLTSTHFSEHWAEYVRRVPALSELMTVFRAYVGARYLVREHPSLAQRIIGWEEPREGPGVPLYNVRPPVILGCIADGRLTELVPGGAVFTTSAGFGGGVGLELIAADGVPKVQYGAAAGPTAETAFVRRVLSDDRGGQIVEGDRRAIVLDVEAPTPIPDRAVWIWAGVCAAVAMVCGIVAWIFRRRARQPVCGHCARIHGFADRAGTASDVLALAALAFVMTLPLLAAVQEADVIDSRALLTTAGVIGGLAAAGLIAAAAHRQVAAVAGWSGTWSGALRGAGAAARWIGVVLVAALAAGGISDEALRDRLVRVLGSRFTEQFLSQFASLAPLRVALLALGAAALAAGVSRWLLPFVLGSRPLPLGPGALHKDRP